MWRIWQLHQLIIATLCLCHPAGIHITINELFQRQHLVFVWLDSCIMNISSISFGRIQNCRVCFVQTSRPMFDADEWIKTFLSGFWFTAAPIENQKNCLHSCMQILQRCVTLPYFEDKKGVKEKETILSNASDGRNVCVIYCLSVYHLLPSSHCLLLPYGQFTLPLDLFPCREFRDVRAYFIVLQYGFNVTYFLTQEYMKHNLVKHSNHLRRPA